MDRWVKPLVWVKPFILGLVVICISCSSPAEFDAGFEEKHIKINDYGLFDLGITDIDNDGFLDIFTANHSGRQSVLVNNGALDFKETFSAMKLDQDPAFPGLVVTEEAPELNHTGLYVYWNGPDIVVRSHGFGPNDPVSGRIEILSPVKITEKNNLKVVVQAEKLPSGATHSILEFIGQGEGHFNFKPYIHALPIQFHLDTNSSDAKVYTGHNLIMPKKMDFAIYMRDRHGMAWTDLNDDNRLDVFITRGGLRGTMKTVPLDFWDELFISTPNAMEEVGALRGLAKDGCAGRQAAWVDYNADDRLDIYVACDREIGEKRFPNKLFQQTPQGDFVDMAAQSGLDLPTGGTFLWVDADLDGDLDLFWSDDAGFSLYRNESGNFSLSKVKTDFPHGRSYHLSLADYDNDGDFDIFSAASKGNVIFVNDKGMLTAVEPKASGLPQKSKTADWVDYDNDGLVDLYTVPDGLYKQTRDAHFKSTSMLRYLPDRWSLDSLAGSRAAWFDADNNGTRDLLLSNQYSMKKSRLAKLYAKLTASEKRFGKLGYIWRSHFLVNNNNENHWLQVQIVGPPSNRQAIGGRVTVTTPAGEQLQQVGGAEGSHYSQGHYRLYFGLGTHAKAQKINVIWPDGHATEMHDIAGDRLLTVTWEENI